MSVKFEKLYGGKKMEYFIICLMFVVTFGILAVNGIKTIFWVALAVTAVAWVLSEVFNLAGNAKRSNFFFDWFVRLVPLTAISGIITLIVRVFFSWMFM